MHVGSAGLPTSAELGLRARGDMHVLFRDQTLLVTRADGEVRGEGIEGAYYANTRLLSRLSLRVNGRPLLPVQVAPARDDLLVAYYHDPRLTGDERHQDRALLVQLTVTLGAGLHLDLDAANHSPAAIACEIGLLFDADFADLEERRHGPRRQQGEVRRSCALEQDGSVRFTYVHPGLDEGALLHFEPCPTCREDGVGWSLDLSPQAAWHACVEVAPVHQGEAVTPVARCYGSFTDEREGPLPWLKHATRVTTSNDSVRRTYERAVQDLGDLALRNGPPVEQPAFAAGVPIYQNAFGRDLLTGGWQALMATPALLESAILTCERYQGRVYDDFRDEQPGRIIQRVRSGPLNLLNLNPFGRYYSDYAAPADFLIMLGQHFMWTGDRDFLRAHLPAAERVLAWLERDADLDGDGFYEY